MISNHPTSLGQPQRGFGGVGDELKVWGTEKPGVGRLFLVYTLYEDEPVMCKMGFEGPEHLSTRWGINYAAYGEGGDLCSDLDICDLARWSYVPATPYWHAVQQKALEIEWAKEKAAKAKV